MQFALFSRIQEPEIINFSFEQIVPDESSSPCVFLRMLQLLISDFAPPAYNQMQLPVIALLSANEEYVNELVI
jgi:hypothetical protein